MTFSPFPILPTKQRYTDTPLIMDVAAATAALKERGIDTASSAHDILSGVPAGERGDVAYLLVCAAGAEVPRILRALLSFDSADVQAFLTKTNVHGADKRGQTPISAVIQDGGDDCLAVVRLLLEQSVDVNASCNSGGATPLHEAAEEGVVGVSAVLISAGAKPDVFNEGGDTPLMTACMFGNESVVSELLAHGAAVNVVNAKAHSALFVAASVGDVACLKVLLAQPNIIHNKCDVEGRTPYYHALKHKQKECAAILKELMPQPDINGPPENLQDPRLRTKEGGEDWQFRYA